LNWHTPVYKNQFEVSKKPVLRSAKTGSELGKNRFWDQKNWL